MLKHELYKIFNKKSVLIAIAIFTVLGLLSFFAQVYSSRTALYKKTVYSIYESFKGDVTQVKMEKVQGEFIRLSRIKNRTAAEEAEYDTYSKIKMYEGLVYKYNAKLTDVEINISTTSGYSKKQNEMLYRIMKKAGEPKIFYTAGWDYIFDYINSSGTFIMVALILLGLASVFTGEFSTGMDSVILCSKNGKRGIITAKLAASAIYIAALDILFLAINFISNILIFGTKGWDAPIQSLMSYVESPYAFTVLQFYLMGIIIHITGCIAFGMLVLLISSLSRNSFIPFASGALIFLLPIIINSSIPIKTPLSETFILFSLTWLMRVQKLFQLYRVYDIFGQPLLYPIFLIILALILAVISVCYTYKNFKNHEEAI
jgi:ABC-type transport system involved in multi-copper enzyme maturation permease subunit